ncbi:MAG TPA: CsbD family protein [Desulfosporosinus sp.]|nr:CsbD family protein [Desulfosporosinus sp.]
MNEDVFKGKWKEIKGSVKAKWGNLTDDDVTKVEGQSEKLVGILQKKYGYSKDKAQEEYNQFMNDHK